jgi:COP9 signalosome complex subunit 7
MLTAGTENKDAFPPLNAAQTTKLKHLSIVSLASQRRVCPLFAFYCCH